MSHGLTWRDVEALHLANPDWSCDRIARALLAGKAHGRRKTELGAWVRATFQRRGWKNSNTRPNRPKTPRPALRTKPVRPPRISSIPPMQPMAPMQPMPPVRMSWEDDKRSRRDERRSRYLRTGDFD